jgi:hypothetical protein
MTTSGIKGTFFIKATKSIEETVEIINNVTNLNLKKDDSGYYEEFPAYSNHVIGIQFALLGPPKQEYRFKDQDYNKYDFLILDHYKFKKSQSIDIAPNLIKLLNSETDLVVRQA